MEQAAADRDSGREREQGSRHSLSNRNCGLESLPAEVLVAILSAARSTEDLHALIRASPRLYQVFVLARREVLLSIVTTDLGPALRDAVAALLIVPVKLDWREPTYLEECERVIHRYEALPCGGDRGLASAASGLSADAVVALSRLNRSVQFLVDKFVASRLSELGKIDPAAANPPTAAERRRLARALLRHQVLARIEYGDCRLRIEDGQHLPREVAMMHTFLRLFRPWETEQLAEAHSFLGEMVVRAFPPGMGQVGPRDPDRPKTPWEKRRDAAIYDLCGLHRELVADEARVAADPTAAWRFRPMRSGMVLSARFRFLRAGPLPVQDNGSRYVAPEHRGLRDELYRREDAMPPLVIDDNGGHGGNDEDTDRAPPFAWVDGHGGVDCQRWGDQVRREVLREGQQDMSARQRIWTREVLDRWRWLGFVFWNRARVELLKTRLAVYETGWLRAAPPSDEELREFYEKASVPRAARPSQRANTVQGGRAAR